MQEINNFFVKSYEGATFSIIADGITGTFSQKYVVGQYISIDNTLVNDGVYKITVVAANKLTLDATLTAEADVDCIVFGLGVPASFASLVAAITAYASGTTQGLAGESQGSRSVSYKDSSSWQKVYRDDLNAYRRMYSDKETYFKHYNIYTKGVV
jgi:hypothetical protein